MLNMKKRKQENKTKDNKNKQPQPDSDALSPIRDDLTVMHCLTGKVCRQVWLRISPSAACCSIQGEH